MGSAGFAEIPAAELGPDLREALAEEAEHSLDPSQRVAIRLDLRAVKL